MRKKKEVIKKMEKIFTYNSRENDEGKLRFPAWQDHCQGTI